MRGSSEHIPAVTGQPGRCRRANGEPSPDPHPLLWRGLPGRRTPSSLRIWHNRIRRVRKRWCGAWFQAAAGPVPAPDASSVWCCVRHSRFPAGSICWARRSMQACACQLTAPLRRAPAPAAASGRAVSPRTQVSVTGYFYGYPCGCQSAWQELQECRSEEG